MLFGIFFGFAALFLALVFLAVKVKKFRVVSATLSVLALLPTVLFGLIAFGFGNIVNYPGDPKQTVVSMVEALGDMAFAEADGYVLGSLDFADETEDEAFARLRALLCRQYAARVSGAPAYDGLIATLPVAFTRLNTDAWLQALAEETELALDDMVQSSPRDEIFTADRTAYLDGVTQQAYDTAFAAMQHKGSDYTVTDTVEMKLLWTPFGWQILLDEELINALEGYAMGDGDEVRFHGDMARRLGARLNTDYGEILDNLPLIEKVYTIAKDALMGCEPNPDGFGSTDDPEEVLKVIEKAKDLIGDRTLSWNPEIVIKPGSTINYYYDESILVIQWKEFRNWSLATFGEVIVKDGSQIRRCIAGNTYRSFDWETPTQMSQRTNAVLGMTGDFYMFRAVGIMAYQGQVYRTDPVSLHHLFFTNSGEMLLTKSYEIAAEDAERYVEEHDVSFSLAFGPVIIENGEKLPMPNYLVGEFYDDYPRAAIGEVDPLHFIVMTVGKEGPRENQTVTLPEAVDLIYEKGVQKAYSLDGGKTANMTFHGELTNDPRYREERTMSDMFYFASAIPQEEWE